MSALHGATSSLDPCDQLDFRCNVCGTMCRASFDRLDRETPSCDGCGSTMRWRSIVRMLSEELFGESLALPDFPIRHDIVGIGLSDVPIYADTLGQKFDYVNTFYDTKPQLDITNIDPRLEGLCDFVISSDVFEHVLHPVSRAFVGARQLLKPGGVLILTVPYGMCPETIEHYPELHDFKLVDLESGTVLVNRTRSGALEVFEDLRFHGGSGATLEMRVCSEAGLLRELREAGFTSVRRYDDDDLAHGLHWTTDWSLPLTARAS